jgi:hypothetical protein
VALVSWAGFALVAILVTRWADAVPGGQTCPARRRLTAPRPTWTTRDGIGGWLGRWAAVVAGAGCAALWTFARDLMTVHGSLPLG